MSVKSAIIFFILISYLVSGIYATDAKVGVFIHAPLVQQTTLTSEPTGPTIDYVKLVLKDMGYNPAITVLPFQRILAELESGGLDLSLEIAKNAEREAFLYYSDKPIHVMIPSLTFLATNKLTAINSINDIDGLTIGYLDGAVKATFFDTVPDTHFDLTSGNSWLQHNLEKLLAGRIDAAFDQNAVSYIDLAKKMGVSDKIKTLQLPGEGTVGYMVFSKKSLNGKALLDAFNKVAATDKYDENKMIDEYMKR
jgi:ABC-type amino acid transport substrate-binding protein